MHVSRCAALLSFGPQCGFPSTLLCETGMSGWLNESRAATVRERRQRVNGLRSLTVAARESELELLMEDERVRPLRVAEAAVLHGDAAGHGRLLG
jgi:hypothetical protein